MSKHTDNIEIGAPYVLFAIVLATLLAPGFALGWGYIVFLLCIAALVAVVFGSMWVVGAVMSRRARR